MFHIALEQVTFWLWRVTFGKNKRLESASALATSYCNLLEEPLVLKESMLGVSLPCPPVWVCMLAKRSREVKVMMPFEEHTIQNWENSTCFLSIFLLLCTFNYFWWLVALQSASGLEMFQKVCHWLPLACQGGMDALYTAANLHPDSKAREISLCTHVLCAVRAAKNMDEQLQWLSNLKHSLAILWLAVPRIGIDILSTWNLNT